MTLLRPDWIHDPKKLKAFHGWLTVFWICNIPFAVTFLKDSVPYLVFISVWANVAGEWSAWQAGRAEMSGNGDSEE